MFPHELFSVVEPFLNAAQEALPQVPVPENATVEVEGLPSIEMEVEERMVVPANTRLRDIAEVATVSFSVPPTPPENAGLGLTLDPSPSIRENFPLTRGASSSGFNEEMSPETIRRRGNIYYEYWHKLARTLRSCGEEASLHKSHAVWRKALFEVVPQKGTNYPYLNDLITNLDEKGSKSPFFQEVADKLLK